MKKVTFLAVCSNAAMLTAQVIVPQPLTAQAIVPQRFWVAATTSNFNNSVNWSAASGGVPGASVPGPSDIAIFDGGGLGNCNFDINIEVAGLEVTSGYSGTINQNTLKVLLDIYNISGEKLFALFEKPTEKATTHNLLFNSNRLANGVYYFRFVTDNDLYIKKIVIID